MLRTALYNLIMKHRASNTSLKGAGSLNIKYIYNNIYHIIKLLSLACATMLLFAIAEMPAVYYYFLRLSVTVCIAVIIVIEIKKIHALWLILFVATGLVFNPVIPVHFYKTSLWLPIYIVSATLFAGYAYKIRRIKNTPPNASLNGV
ncbi:hypothetical protein Q765_04250 [Flavobacterium rivuli WB 3.3-2 = DSM 21788]|uniref:Uncharacterized protein n=2 Tax=Flavobacterium rivuli TaxID=498301 RepID=A0A0A2M9Z8_9FLAO|nr:hypothetical protein Q765_04250 [Flavobacterium rivuli WB 3.3-2 = DSM 21788]